MYKKGTKRYRIARVKTAHKGTGSNGPVQQACSKDKVRNSKVQLGISAVHIRKASQIFAKLLIRIAPSLLGHLDQKANAFVNSLRLPPQAHK